MVMAWAGGRVSLGEMFRAWALVHLGNFIGATVTALLVFAAASYGHVAGVAALGIAEGKASLPFLPALVRGILGNVLVCLAVWLCYGAHTTTERILRKIG
jgi:formate/nitrite transporter FocA (FNT family)